MTTAEFSRPVDAARLRRRETVIRIEADAAERAALAARFDLLAIESLKAEARLKPLGDTARIRLRASFEADVVQACVVSLEPVPARIVDSFEVFFAPSGDDAAAGEIEFSIDEDDPPDPIVDGVIDIGEAVAEHLALALDPFPRAAGATGIEPSTTAAEEVRKTNPFAVLAAFDKKSG